MNLRNDSRDVEFGEITFAIPAQTFGITCAISTEQTLPVVTEFALRIVSVCDSLTPQDLQQFFGFSEREVEQVIQSLVDERLLRWEEDRLELTHYARGLFVSSPDSLPRLTKIKDWAGEVAFELVGFTHVNPTDGAKRARLMVEISTADPEKESKSRLWAERSFQENFDKIYRGSRAEIYKISDVEASTRFLLAVPCTFCVSLDGELTIKRSLPDDFLSERLELSQAITKALAFPPIPDNRSLNDFAEVFGDPSFQSFIQSDGSFDLSAYLAKVMRADNANATTRSIIGSLHLDKNIRLLETSIASFKLDPGKIPTLYWIAPAVPFWARSKRMRPLVASLRRMIEPVSYKAPQTQDAKADEDGQSSCVKILLQNVREGDRHAARTYGGTLPEVYSTSASTLDGKVEVVLVEDKFMCALYHYQVRHAVTIPIGFMSTEEKYIRIAEQVLKRVTEPPAQLRTLTRGAPQAESVFR